MALLENRVTTLEETIRVTNQFLMRFENFNPFDVVQLKHISRITEILQNFLKDYNMRRVPVDELMQLRNIHTFAKELFIMRMQIEKYLLFKFPIQQQDIAEINEHLLRLREFLNNTISQGTLRGAPIQAT